MLSRWLTYYPNFSDAFSRDLTRKSLALILEISANDLEFSGIKLQSGSFTKEDVLLQVGVLSMLASDLVYMPKEEGGGEGKEGHAAADEDFEDEDEMDYDEENAGEGGAEFGGDFNDNENDIDGEQQDEAALMSNFKIPIHAAQFDYKETLITTIRKIG